MAEDNTALQQDHLVSTALLEKIDKLRERNIGKEVPLPQVRTSLYYTLFKRPYEANHATSSSWWATRAQASLRCSRV